MASTIENIGRNLVSMVEKSNTTTLCELYISFYSGCKEKYRITFEDKCVQLWILTEKKTIIRNAHNNRLKAIFSTDIALIKKFKTLNIDLLSIIFEEFILDNLFIGDIRPYDDDDSDIDDIRTFRFVLKGKNMSKNLLPQVVEKQKVAIELFSQIIHLKYPLDYKNYENITKLKCTVKRKLSTAIKVRTILEKKN